MPTVSLSGDVSGSKVCTAATALRSNMTYTITLTDPDAPSRENPKWSEMCHWIATGASVSSTEHCKHCSLQLSFKDLKEIMPYKPPGPPPKTGPHRYVFLVWAPKNGTTDQLHLTKPKDRQHWGTGEEGGGVRDWAEENGLVVVGGNFVYAANKKQ
jgi:phosphatidylethanolamine-binding protein